jgi:hypothetical protein
MEANREGMVLHLGEAAMLMLVVLVVATAAVNQLVDMGHLLEVIHRMR